MIALALAFLLSNGNPGWTCGTPRPLATDATATVRVCTVSR